MEPTVIKRKNVYKKASSSPKPSQEDVARFNQLKAIDHQIRRHRKVDDDIFTEIQKIQNDFQASGNDTGTAQVHKVWALYFVKKVSFTENLGEKILNLELAHDHINQAVLISGNQLQSSLLKHQGTIKSLLAALLHQNGDHHNANLLQTDASRILGKLVYEHPDYPEARLEMLSAQVRKLPTTLHRILHELEKTEEFFDNPTYTKHLPDSFEQEEYRIQISGIREYISQLVSITI